MKKTNFLVALLSVAVFAFVTQAFAKGGGNGGGNGGGAGDPTLENATIFTVLADSSLTVDVSGVVGSGRTFTVSYIVGTTDGAGNTTFNTGNTVTSSSLSATEGASYALSGLSAGDAVKFWITDAINTSYDFYLIEDRTGWVTGSGRLFTPDGLQFTVPVQTPPGSDDQSYVVTIKGMESDSTVYASGTSGQPLPGVLVTIGIAGAIGAYAKRRRDRAAAVAMESPE